MSSEFVDLKFLNAREAVQRSTIDRRAIDPHRVCKYFIPYLDDFLKGIGPSDLIVVGADTGMGKTEFVNHMALRNAMDGRRVFLFSLEGDKNEVMLRWKWKIICREYFKNPDGKEMSYQLFIMNMLPGISELEDFAENEISQLENNLFIFDRSEQLNIKLLAEQINKIEEADLVIIDHLHYFNMFEDKSEQENISLIMREIRELTDMKRIPIILVSHLRKKDKARGVPDVHEFMGSSNIAKVASTCITISNRSVDNILDRGLYATLFSIAKNRGESTALAGHVMFDGPRKAYVEGYTLGTILQNEYKPIAYASYPGWARRANVGAVMIL